MELLVVVSLVTALLAMLLPVLSSAKDSSQRIQCGSNLKQLMVGWEAAMIERKGVIPLTQRKTGDDRWSDLLAEQLPELPQILPGNTSPDSFGVCPTVHSRFPRVVYGNPFIGYAVNARWNEGQPIGANEHQAWSSIQRPSSYPWLADPFVTDSIAPVGASWIGSQSSDGVSWKVGFYHLSDTANTTFADGHVDSVERTAFEHVDFNGTPKWFLADH